MNQNEFVQKFKSYLNTESERLEHQVKQLKSESREDEYKFAQIELNIVDIFSKMFEISYKKISNLDQWAQPLKEHYLSYFTRIPASWKLNLEECKQHGLDDEVYIETLKLNKAESIKHHFLLLLDQSQSEGATKWKKV